MKKELIINLGLLIGSLLIFFFAIEFVLRITGLQSAKPNPPKIFQQSNFADISYELIPNLKNEKAYRGLVSTNSLGFRSPEIESGKPIVAILGDSITFGYGVNDDQTLSAYMSNLNSEYNFLNTAAPGYNLEMEAATYREKVRHLDPAVIVLVFYFNDLTGTIGVIDDLGILRSNDWNPSQRDCRPIDKGLLGMIPGKCWLDEHSAFYKAFKKVINLRYSKKHIAKLKEESDANLLEDEVTDVQLVNYSAQLDSFVALMPEDQKRIFVIWPDHLMHTSLPKLIAIAEERGFKVIDLYETFENKVPTLGWDTVHPNPEAIEGAAKIIVESINLNE
ncbi:SGNH/GDSL hydrolase family protein [Patescibacteria group bacterium]|nr:SGNH/GDSL hydrolase family protein [Patescibacteria group bacterium]